MYGRKVIMTKINSGDPNSVLRDFAHSLVYSAYYDIIVQNLFDTPGFIQKTQCMIESKDTNAIVGMVTFESKETFDNYANDPSTQSIMESLITNGCVANVAVSMIDGGEDVLNYTV